MKNKLLIIALFVISAVALSSCGAYKDVAQANLQAMLNQRFQVVRTPQQQFYDLTFGLQVMVNPTQPQMITDKNIYQMSNSGIFHTPTISYVRSMGFKEMNSGQDYSLTITLNKVDVNIDNNT